MTYEELQNELYMKLITHRLDTEEISILVDDIDLIKLMIKNKDISTLELFSELRILVSAVGNSKYGYDIDGFWFRYLDKPDIWIMFPCDDLGKLKEDLAEFKS